MISGLEIDKIAIIVILLVVCFVSVCIFYFQNKRAKQLHIMTMNSYEDAMKENEAQIRIRKTRLLRYDFLEHNLNAALEPQTNIKIP